MSTRVFVGGLTYRVRERDLEKFFRKYGRIKEVAMKNGFAFVEFDDYRDADDAVYELNGKELLGERITVERARGTPRGSDQWRYGDSRGGYGDSRRSADSVNRNTRTASSYKQSLPRYGPPTRTEYRLTVENLSSRVSWQDLKDYMRQAGEVTYADAHKQRRNEGVVEFATYSDLKNAIDKLDDTELNGRRIRLIEDKRQVAVVPVAAAVAVAVPNQEHIRSPNPSLNPNLRNAAAHVPNPNQETAQSRNLSQSPNPDLVLGPRLRGQSPGRSPNPKPSLPQRIDRAASAHEVTDLGHDREASTARAVVVPVHL
ncbi:Serine-arginine protein 55 [Harpegnathos saltator]|uniref:Serine-arginine protein 55 n=1 Tax=Harpegnathos saltator TaxID=610380 RepID=E2C8V1_HARSA|nr:Serine-arginine protein 55 [Harpegnathos saltator]